MTGPDPMPPQAAAAPPAGRLARWCRDLPFVEGRPVAISGFRWLLILGMTLLGYVILISPLSARFGPVPALLPGVIFMALPLLALILEAPRGWHALFRRPRLRDLVLVPGFILLNIAVTFSVALVVKALVGVTANPAAQIFTDMGGGEQLRFLLRIVPQLFGEELMTILPFLAMVTALRRVGLGPAPALVLGWIGSSLVFGLAHLPTYDWNLVQSLVLIGMARMVLTLSYIVSRNILVSTAVHVGNDWLIFGVSLAAVKLGAA